MHTQSALLCVSVVCLPVNYSVCVCLCVGMCVGLCTSACGTVIFFLLSICSHYLKRLGLCMFKAMVSTCYDMYGKCNEVCLSVM